MWVSPLTKIYHPTKFHHDRKKSKKSPNCTYAWSKKFPRAGEIQAWTIFERWLIRAQCKSLPLFNWIAKLCWYESSQNWVLFVCSTHCPHIRSYSCSRQGLSYIRSNFEKIYKPNMKEIWSRQKPVSFWNQTIWRSILEDDDKDIVFRPVVSW